MAQAPRGSKRQAGLEGEISFAGQDVGILVTRHLRSCSWCVRAGGHVTPGRESFVLRLPLNLWEAWRPVALDEHCLWAGQCPWHLGGEDRSRDQDQPQGGSSPRRHRPCLFGAVLSPSEALLPLVIPRCHSRSLHYGLCLQWPRHLGPPAQSSNHL